MGAKRHFLEGQAGQPVGSALQKVIGTLSKTALWYAGPAVKTVAARPLSQPERLDREVPLKHKPPPYLARAVFFEVIAALSGRLHNRGMLMTSASSR